MRHAHRKLTLTLVLLAPVATALADPDWSTVPLVRHDVYQAVNSDGSSAYTPAFPIRLRGVVLNNAEDWLDPAANFNTTPWDLGGQWEIFVQAQDDPNQTYDDGDFGGTSCWIGQNYGNLPWIGDPNESYTDAEWLGELNRLEYSDPTFLRAGDLIEVRARGGLAYAGKMNVNEQHNKLPDFDFDIVVLEHGYGLPTPTPITLSDLKDETDAFFWDPTRLTGGEHVQSTRVLIKGVQFIDTTGWGPDTDLVLVDSTGRTFDIHLGHNPSFAEIPPTTATVNVIGVINQEASSGIGGYYVMAMNAADIVCGDANCDGVRNFGDINPFVQALLDPAAYAIAYPGCIADMTGDFAMDFADINPFVDAMINGVCP